MKYKNSLANIFDHKFFPCYSKLLNRLMSYLLQQNNQEAEHPLRVPGLPADFEQPGWARPDHHSEALGQTKVPGHKSVSWLQLLSHLNTNRNLLQIQIAATARHGLVWGSAQGTLGGCLLAAL